MAPAASSTVKRHRTAICRKNLFGYSETSDYSLSDSFFQIFANSTPSTCKLVPKLGAFTKKVDFWPTNVHLELFRPYLEIT